MRTELCCDKSACATGGMASSSIRHADCLSCRCASPADDPKDRKSICAQKIGSIPPLGLITMDMRINSKNHVGEQSTVDVCCVGFEAGPVYLRSSDVNQERVAFRHI